MKRGEVYWAELSPRSGSEQAGRRPVVILSHDAFNLAARWRSIIVIPTSTSPSQAGRGPTVVPVQAGIAGLSKDCVFLCHQITTLDRTKLVEKIGVLPAEFLSRVELAVAAALDMPRRAGLD